MVWRWFFAAFFWGIVTGVIAPVWAQVIPQADQNNAAKQNQRIQQRERENARELDRAIKDKKGDPGEIEIVPSPDGLLPGGAKGCFQVDQIHYPGATLLTAQELKNFSQPYVGKCVNLDAFNELLRAVTNSYADKGFVTSRAFLKPQNVKDRIVDITVVEGVLSAIEIDGKETHLEKRFATAFPNLKGSTSSTGWPPTNQK